MFYALYSWRLAVDPNCLTPRLCENGAVSPRALLPPRCAAHPQALRADVLTATPAVSATAGTLSVGEGRGRPVNVAPIQVARQCL